MQRALVIVGVLAAGCAGPGEGGSVDAAADGDGAGADGAGGDGADGAGGDGAGGDGAGGDGAAGGDAMPDGGAVATILFQCTPFDGGLCAMGADGSDRRTLHATGFVPHGAAGGAILFHTAGYRVARRGAGGAIEDLGDGAFARPRPGGGILFQCSGLGGGVCTMAADGGQRSEVRAGGRVPDVDATGRILFHTDGYRIIRRAPGGGEQDLGDGAFATWTDDGRILFQCSGLGGGLCRMAADGSGRETLAASGRVPAADASGRVVFHSDAYQVMVRTASATTAIGAGANAGWW